MKTKEIQFGELYAVGNPTSQWDRLGHQPAVVLAAGYTMPYQGFGSSRSRPTVSRGHERGQILVLIAQKQYGVDREPKWWAKTLKAAAQITEADFVAGAEAPDGWRFDTKPPGHVISPWAEYVEFVKTEEAAAELNRKRADEVKAKRAELRTYLASRLEQSGLGEFIKLATYSDRTEPLTLEQLDKLLDHIQDERDELIIGQS